MNEKEKEQLDQITRDLELIKNYLFTPPHAGEPTRAARLDDLLFASKIRGVLIRYFLWMCAVVVTLNSAWAVISTRIPWK